MAYTVKECFYTLQGEGAQAGRAAVFLRFAGCNLWSGREADRASAACSFCDTDFVGTDGAGGGKFRHAAALAEWVAARWPGAGKAHGGQADGGRAVEASPGGRPYVVCTGGEPLLQLDEAAVAALHAKGFEVAVETNGTQMAPPGLDWICVSPKGDAPLALTAGDELKLVYPQALAPPERFAGLAFDHFFLQPLDGPAKAEHTRACVAYCLAHPQWRLSVQVHKVLGIP